MTAILREDAPWPSPAGGGPGPLVERIGALDPPPDFLAGAASHRPVHARREPHRLRRARDGGPFRPWRTRTDSRASTPLRLADAELLSVPPGKVLDETTGFISRVRASPKGDRLAFADRPLCADDIDSVAVVDPSGRRRLLHGGLSHRLLLDVSKGGAPSSHGSRRRGASRR